MLVADLAPKAQHPCQLQQAIQAYNYRSRNEDGGRELSPKNILLAGDSAGAHLALGLLSAIAHPRQDLGEIGDCASLPSTMIVSPWVKFDISSDSMTRNLYKDCLAPLSLWEWSLNFLGKTPQDNYNCPLLADTQWWRALEGISMGIVCGVDEAFIDDNDLFVQVLQDAWLKPDYHGVDGEAHDVMIWGPEQGIPNPAPELYSSTGYSGRWQPAQPLINGKTSRYQTWFS